MNKYNPRAIYGSGIILNTHTEMKVMQPDVIYNTEAKYCEGIFYELRVPLYSFEYEGWNDFWSIVTPPGFNSINYLEGDDIFFWTWESQNILKLKMYLSAHCTHDTGNYCIWKAKYMIMAQLMN